MRLWRWRCFNEINADSANNNSAGLQLWFSWLISSCNQWAAGSAQEIGEQLKKKKEEAQTGVAN